MQSKVLPQRPDLSYLKKAAKQLRALHHQHDATVCPRIRHFDIAFANKTNVEIFAAKFSILDAQRIVAREYGFSSWAKLKRFIESSNSQFEQALCDELLALQANDAAMRQKLLDEGVLYDGYQASMQAVHEANADRLDQIIDQYGWPGSSLVGLAGCRAAWLIAQHAISRPAFQKKCLVHLTQAVEAGQAPARQLATLTDRIRFNQLKPQRYGMILDFDHNGELSCNTIEDADKVNERRALMGIGAIEVELEKHQAKISKEIAKLPAQNYEKRQHKMAQWARETGWLE